MDVQIGELVSEVRTVDDRDVLRPEVLAQVVAATIAELERRRLTDARAARETQLWSSVRSGSGR